MSLLPQRSTPRAAARPSSTASGTRRRDLTGPPVGSLEAPDLGNEDRALGPERTPGKPTTHRYSQAEKDQAVRLVRQLQAETGKRHGTVQRVAAQLGYAPVGDAGRHRRRGGVRDDVG